MSGGAVEKSIECPICFNYFNHPKQLPCNHTFCLKCLKEFCENDGGKKSCPMCRRKFNVPQGGVEMLPDNQVLMRFDLEKGARKRKLESSMCELCEEDDVKAESFCMDCKQCLCERCKKIHSKMNSSKLHKVVGMEDKPSAEDLARMQSNYCAKHTGEEFKLYCYECNELLCYYCHAAQHFKHKCVALLETAKSLKDSLQQDRERLVKCCDEEKSKERDQRDKREILVRKVTNMGRAIDFLFDKMSKDLQAHKSDLVNLLQEVRKRNEEEFRRKDEATILNNVELDNFLKYSGRVMDQGTESDIIRVADELQRKAKELIKSQDERKNQQWMSVTMTRDLRTILVQVKGLNNIRKQIEDLKKDLE